MFKESEDFLGVCVLDHSILLVANIFFTPHRLCNWTFLAQRWGRSLCHTAGRWIHRLVCSSVNTSSPWEFWCSTRIENCLAPRPSWCFQLAQQGHGWSRRSLGCSPWFPHSALSRSSCAVGCIWVPSIQSWDKKIFARLPDAPASSYCSLSCCKLGDALRSFFIL